MQTECQKQEQAPIETHANRFQRAPLKAFQLIRLKKRSAMKHASAAVPSNPPEKRVMNIGITST